MSDADSGRDLPEVGRVQDPAESVGVERLVVVDGSVQELFMDVLEQHSTTYNGEWNCECGAGFGWPSDQGWRRHVALELAHALALRENR